VAYLKIPNNLKTNKIDNPLISLKKTNHLSYKSIIKEASYVLPTPHPNDNKG
jgi:hypothetical protein